MLLANSYQVTKKIFFLFLLQVRIGHGTFSRCNANSLSTKDMMYVYGYMKTQTNDQQLPHSYAMVIGGEQRHRSTHYRRHRTNDLHARSCTTSFGCLFAC